MLHDSAGVSNYGVSLRHSWRVDGGKSNKYQTLPALMHDQDKRRTSEVADAHRRLDPGLRRFFISRGASPEQLDDLSQNTWGVVWGALREGKYDPARAALSTFVYAVAVKVWLRERRRLAREPNWVEALAERLLSPVGDASDAAALAELLERVGKCLSDARFSDEERHVLAALSRGVSDRELARELGVAPSTAHARKASALARLRRLVFPGSSPTLPPDIAERSVAPGEQPPRRTTDAERT
jgi:RNA polymerase sigma factor (sigma-70 family)